MGDFSNDEKIIYSLKYALNLTTKDPTAAPGFEFLSAPRIFPSSIPTKDLLKVGEGDIDSEGKNSDGVLVDLTAPYDTVKLYKIIDPLTNKVSNKNINDILGTSFTSIKQVYYGASETIPTASTFSTGTVYKYWFHDYNTSPYDGTTEPAFNWKGIRLAYAKSTPGDVVLEDDDNYVPHIGLYLGVPLLPIPGSSWSSGTGDSISYEHPKEKGRYLLGLLGLSNTFKTRILKNDYNTIKVDTASANEGDTWFTNPTYGLLSFYGIKDTLAGNQSGIGVAPSECPRLSFCRYIGESVDFSNIGGGGGASVTVGESGEDAPTDGSKGDLFFDIDDDTLKINKDGTADGWVGVGGGGGVTNEEKGTGLAQSQVLESISTSLNGSSISPNNSNAVTLSTASAQDIVTNSKINYSSWTEQVLISSYKVPENTKQLKIKSSFFITKGSQAIEADDQIIQWGIFIDDEVLINSLTYEHLDLIEKYINIETSITIGEGDNLSENKINTWSGGKKISIRARQLYSSPQAKFNYSNKYGKVIYPLLELKAIGYGIVGIGGNTKNQALESIVTCFNGSTISTNKSGSLTFNKITSHVTTNTTSYTQITLISSYIPPENTKSILINYSLLLSKGWTTDKLNQQGGLLEWVLVIDNQELSLSKNSIHIDLVDKYATISTIINIGGNTDYDNNKIAEWTTGKKISVKCKSLFTGRNIKLHFSNDNESIIFPTLELIASGEAASSSSSSSTSSSSTSGSISGGMKSLIPFQKEKGNTSFNGALSFEPLNKKLNTNYLKTNVVEGSSFKEIGVINFQSSYKHSLVVTNDKNIYFCGTDRNSGNTITGTLTNLNNINISGSYPFYPTIKSIYVTKVALGSEHSLFLTNEGSVYAYGMNTTGQLGQGNLKGYYSIVSCAVNDTVNDTIKDVKCGGYVSSALSEKGDLYLWGLNYSKIAGTSQHEDGSVAWSRIAKMNFGDGIYIEDYDLGVGIPYDEASSQYYENHIIVKTNENKILAWGDNRDIFNMGQNASPVYKLGTDGNEKTFANRVDITSKISNAISDSGTVAQISQICLGGSFSSILVNGDIYVWGDNSKGQLGRNGISKSIDPLKVTSGDPERPIKNVKKISCGAQEMVVLTVDGKIWYWGNQPSQPFALPTTYMYFNGDATNEEINIIDIAEKSYKTNMVLDDKGRIYSWGSNKYYQFGNGKKSDNIISDAKQGKMNFYKSKIGQNIINSDDGLNLLYLRFMIDAKPYPNRYDSTIKVYSGTSYPINISITNPKVEFNSSGYGYPGLYFTRLLSKKTGNYTEIVNFGGINLWKDSSNSLDFLNTHANSLQESEFNSKFRDYIQDNESAIIFIIAFDEASANLDFNTSQTDLLRKWGLNNLINFSTNTTVKKTGYGLNGNYLKYYRSAYSALIIKKNVLGITDYRTGNKDDLIVLEGPISENMDTTSPIDRYFPIEITKKNCRLGIGTNSPQAPLHIYMNPPLGPTDNVAGIILESKSLAFPTWSTDYTVKANHGFGPNNIIRGPIIEFRGPAYHGHSYTLGRIQGINYSTGETGGKAISGGLIFQTSDDGIYNDSLIINANNVSTFNTRLGIGENSPHYQLTMSASTRSMVDAIDNTTAVRHGQQYMTWYGAIHAGGWNGEGGITLGRVTDSRPLVHNGSSTAVYYNCLQSLWNREGSILKINPFGGEVEIGDNLQINKNILFGRLNCNINHTGNKQGNDNLQAYQQGFIVGSGGVTDPGSFFIGIPTNGFVPRNGARPENGCSGMEINNLTTPISSGKYSQNLHFWTHHFANGGGARLSLRYDGNVGISTENPGAKLEVVLDSSSTDETNPGGWDKGLVKFGEKGNGGGIGFMYKSNGSNIYSLSYDGGNRAWKQLRFRANGYKFYVADTSIGELGKANGTYPYLDLTNLGFVSAGKGNDITSHFGCASIGHCGHPNYASFAHTNQNTTTNYALLQHSTGSSYLNAAVGKYVSFRIGNTEKAIFNSLEFRIHRFRTSHSTHYTEFYNEHIESPNSSMVMNWHSSHSILMCKGGGDVAIGNWSQKSAKLTIEGYKSNTVSNSHYMSRGTYRWVHNSANNSSGWGQSDKDIKAARYGNGGNARMALLYGGGNAIDSDEYFNGTGNISLYASNALWTNDRIYFTSDRRIKTNIINVSDNISLDILRDISCCIYEYKDKVVKGFAPTIGFLAQQVAQNYPMAVTINKNFIPNELRNIENVIWERIDISGSDISGGDISGNIKYKLTIPDLEDVSGNTRYKFYMSNDISGNDECEKISFTLEDDPKSFIFDQSWNYVFLYGKEVDDFHILDKDKLYSLNFSATQEIDRIQQRQIGDISLNKIDIEVNQIEINEAKQKINLLETENTTLKDRVINLETQNSNLLSRLEALEKKINDLS